MSRRISDVNDAAGGPKTAHDSGRDAVLALHSDRLAIARRAAAGVACSWVLMFVGCGGDENASTTTAPGDGQSVASPATTSTAPVQEHVAFEANRTVLASETQSDGTKVVFELGFGRLTAARDGNLPEPFSALVNTCGHVVSERDAFMPLRLRVTNANPAGDGGFSASIPTGLSLTGGGSVETGYSSNDLSMELASNFSGGASCESGSGVGRILLPLRFDNVAAQETRTHDMLLVVHNYYTPASPTGRPDGFAQIRGTFLLGPRCVYEGGSHNGEFAVSEDVPDLAPAGAQPDPDC